MGSRTLLILPAVFVLAAVVLAALVIAVASGDTLGLDSAAFSLGRDLRAPWLDPIVKVVTTAGALAVVGPCVFAGAVVVFRRGRPLVAAWLVSGFALSWLGWQVVKVIVGRHRPSDSLVHTTGSSFPSGHAANSVAYLALGIAASSVLRSRGARFAAIACGLVVSLVVGWSRVYLRAHYLSDVLAGYSAAIAVYAGVAIVALLTIRHGHPAAGQPPP